MARTRVLPEPSICQNSWSDFSRGACGLNMCSRANMRSTSWGLRRGANVKDQQWAGWTTLTSPLVSALAGRHSGLVLGGMLVVMAMTYVTVCFLVLTTRTYT